MEKLHNFGNMFGKPTSFIGLVIIMCTLGTSINVYNLFYSNGINYPLRIMYYGNRPQVTVDW